MPSPLLKLAADDPARPLAGTDRNIMMDQNDNESD